MILRICRKDGSFSDKMSYQIILSLRAATVIRPLTDLWVYTVWPGRQRFYCLLSADRLGSFFFWSCPFLIYSAMRLPQKLQC